MALRSFNPRDVIYAPVAPGDNLKLGQLWVDTDEVPPTAYICTSLSPVTFVPVAAGASATNLSYTASTRTVNSSTGTGTVLPLVTSAEAGLAPASGGGTVNFLRADGSWVAPTASAAWGSITGTLSAQTDLNTALAARALTATAINTTAPLTGGGDLSATRTLSVTANGITNALFRQSAGTTVVARAAGTTGDVADLAATADNQLLVRRSGALTFGALVDADVPGTLVRTSRTLTTTAPLAGGGDLSADRTFSITANGITDALLRQGAGASVIGRSAGTTGNVADIAAGADGQYLRRASGALAFAAIADADVPATIVRTSRAVNTTAPLTGGGALTGDLALAVAAFTSVASGIVPASGGGTTNFLRADGAWAAPPGGGGAPTDATYLTVSLNGTLTNERALAVGASLTAVDSGANAAFTLSRAALTGDVTAPADGNATTIANDAVSYAKMQNVSAASRLLGRGDSGAGDPQEIVLGTNLTMTGTTLNATGGGGQSAVQFQDEGANLGTAGTVTTVNYVGLGVTATRSVDAVTVTIPGGAGGFDFGLAQSLANNAAIWM